MLFNPDQLPDHKSMRLGQPELKNEIFRCLSPGQVSEWVEVSMKITWKQQHGHKSFPYENGILKI